MNRTRGSVMYVRDGYIPTTLIINEKEENTVGSEFIHLRLAALPSLNMIGVCLEPATTSEAAIKTKKVLTDKVQRCVDRGENCVIMGDMNAAINDNAHT